MANSVDPDETPHSAASHLGLNCLLRPVCPNTYGKYGISRKKVYLPKVRGGGSGSSTYSFSVSSFFFGCEGLPALQTNVWLLIYFCITYPYPADHIYTSIRLCPSPHILDAMHK